MGVEGRYGYGSTSKESPLTMSQLFVTVSPGRLIAGWKQIAR